MIRQEIEIVVIDYSTRFTSIEVDLPGYEISWIGIEIRKTTRS